MAALIALLLPAVSLSTDAIQDEKSLRDVNGSTGLRNRMMVPEDREPSAGRGLRFDRALPERLPPERNPFPPTPSPVPQELPEIRDPIRPAPTSPPTTPPPKVITFGDSYSSGTGIHRDGDEYDVEDGGSPTLNGVTYHFTANDNNECWQELHTTPGPRYAAFVNQESVFLGCKGAQMAELNDQLDYLLAKYPLDRANSFQGSTILLTAGGNDLRTQDGQTWPELLEHCILWSLWCHSNNDNQIANFPQIKSSASAFYSQLVEKASGATIRVLGYPRMMQRDPGCGSVTGISRSEADWVDDQCDELNDMLNQAVNTVKGQNPSVDIEFVDVTSYLTVGACGNGPSNRHVHDKILHSNLLFGTSDSSFHPSQKGYDEYYAAFLASL